ncbi:hypothetical protein SAMN02927937_02922 [Paenimyroides aquimaris]|uniref:Uncharacterized protein n=1 Tax=Paenimyroides marinum TaxID=1159016 RepID=A0A1H6MQR5_9FLAO|nr:hypothetical protein [Paenimyroides aquimaris]SEI04234.1 hypothetical protein SAMN02927937_02922 [Paenimyroides aquimaris]
MTTKRIMGIVAIVILVVVIGFIFILYATIKTKSTSLNNYEPFKEWVGKTVTLNKETVLFKEKIRMNSNSSYPYMLLDSLHPQWRYVEEQKAIGDIEEIMNFPAGSIEVGDSNPIYERRFGVVIPNDFRYDYCSWNGL